MNNYLIFTDAAADVDVSLFESHGVKIIPMEYIIDDETFVYNCSESRDDIKVFYDKLRAGKMPKTTQINPFCYEEFFSPYLKDGFSVLYLCLSSGLSSTYTSACTASSTLKEQFPNVDFVPIDSLNATAGMGLLLEEMCKNRDNGLDIFENKTATENFRNKIYGNCFVEDLMHLKRGGRISTAKAVFGTMLGIKPIIKMTEDGKLDMIDKKKGSRTAVSALVANYQTYGDIDGSSSVYVSDSDCAEMADFAANKILSINPNAVIKYAPLSPIIGTHLGPSSVVIFFIKN